MMTKYEEQMYHDIHRIANALEELVKLLKPTTNPTITSPYIIPNNLSDCENCLWYQQQKNNPNPTITVGDTPCTWCPKLQPTCKAVNNDK